MRRKHRTTELSQYQNSPVSIKTVRHELIKAGYHGRAPSGNLRFSLSTFRRGWSGVDITMAGLQTNGSEWYFPTSPVFLFLNYRASLCVEVAQGILQPWLTSSHSEARKWISDGLDRHIVEFFRSSWTSWESVFIQCSSIIPWWCRLLPRRQYSDTYHLCG